MKFLGKVFARVKRPFYKKILNITNGHTNLTKRALVNLKTEPFFNYQDRHNNIWEIICIVKTLNSIGYIVDLIDRDCEGFVPEDKYDVFFGYGSGNSGKQFYDLCYRLNCSKKILFATGPLPELSNKLVRKRYDEFFFLRTGIHAPYMRLIDVDFERFASVATNIFCYAEENTFSFNSYNDRFPNVHSIIPSTPQKTLQKKSDLKRQRFDNYLCLAGSGLICKGVDVVIEAFLKYPDKQLHICGPIEPGIEQAYKKHFVNSNIHFHGFISLNSKSYERLIDKCAFTILNSAAEGCATSSAIR